jgi:transcriptional regulator with XRE-family HTH domain
MGKAGRPKNQEVRKQVERFINQNSQVNFSDIARELGVSRAYVSLIAKELGFSGQPEDVSEIIAGILELSGLSQSGLAEMMGISRTKLNKWANATKHETPDRAEPAAAARLKLLLDALHKAARRVDGSKS